MGLLRRVAGGSTQRIGPRARTHLPGCDHRRVSAGQQSSTDRTDSTDVVTVEEPRPEGDLPEDKRRKRLASYTVRNMVWSMLLVLAFVLVWWSLTFNPE